MEPWKTIIEPFRIHAVEPIRMTTREEREAELERAGWNLFRVPAERVLIDLRARDPDPPGRAAEKILFSAIGGPGKTIPNNTHFDTTRANVEFTGAEALDLPTPEARVPSERHPFKGNMDVEALRRVAERDVPCVFVTVTNNSGGGQPVSLENLRAVREACGDTPLYLDACRFVENAWFVKQREPGYADVPVAGIVREMASLADGMTMSAKKDPLGNIGGWLALNDDRLAERCRNLLILTEGSRPTAAWRGATWRRSRRDCARLWTRTTCATGSARPSTWATRSTGRDPGRAAGRRPRGLHRRPRPARPRPAARVPGPGPGRGALSLGRDQGLRDRDRDAARAGELRGMRIVEEPPALRHFTARFEPLTS